MPGEQKNRILALARRVKSISGVPDHVRQSVVKVLADALAAAVAGHKTDGAIAAQKTAVELGGQGPASIWFTGKKTSYLQAAYANAMATCILDLDDGHRAAAGHPGAGIVPAVLAAAQATEASSEDTIVAISVGYMVAVSIAASRDPANIKTNITGHWVGQGVAAAVGWLMKDDENTIAHAMALAGATAPDMQVAAYTKAGGHAKEGIPWATSRGLCALVEARNGMKGPLDILDQDDILADELIRDEAQEWHIESVYLKLYGCCRWWHGAIDGILDIRKTVPDWSAVTQIVFYTFERTNTQPNLFRPPGLEDAQYSARFCIAAAAIHGAECLQPMSRDLLTDGKVLALAEKVTIVTVPKYSDMFRDRKIPGRVKVVTKETEMDREVLIPKGEATNPLSWEELMEKLRRLALQATGKERAARLEAALVSFLHDMNFRALMEFL